jgi:glycosyltransferase involved in cell wall biosynthesis
MTSSNGMTNIVPNQTVSPVNTALLASPNLSIVIPAYNEQAIIGDVIAGLKEELQNRNYEIIVVDDGSCDNTFEIVKGLGVKVIRHEFNKGYGASLKTGASESSGEIVLFLDGDGQHDARDVVRLLEHFPEYDMVVGARTKNSSYKPLLRRPGKRILSMFANFLAGTKIPDLNSGLRAFKKDILFKYIHLLPSGFSFSTTTTFAFLKSNRRIKYVPIAIRKRVGKSSVKQFRHGFQTIMLMLRLIVLFEPLKVFLSTSFLLFVLGCASTVHNIVRNSANITDVTVLLLISSLLIFFLGLLTDQVSAMRREKRE